MPEHDEEPAHDGGSSQKGRPALDVGYEPSLTYARERDRHDPLRQFRRRFTLPRGRIYMDGNSLGAPPHEAVREVHRALRDWQRLGIDGWLSAAEPWFGWAEQIGRRQAPLVGAEPDEVVVTGGTTINLHQLVATFYHPRAGRTKILTDALNFPSDRYALEAQIALRGRDPREHLIAVASEDGHTIAEAALERAMTADVALVMLPSVLYRSGQLLDMQRLTRSAHERGIEIGFDLSHSAGCVPHALHAWDVDFAFWCNYKYLNAGPGSLASLFVHRRHFGRRPALAGWWGSDKARQFDMDSEFTPAAGAGAWQIGTPGILSLAAASGALDVTLDAGIERIRDRSLALTGYLMFLADRQLTPYEFQIATPREPERRGGHVALTHPAAVQICKALKARGVVPDFRPPNVIRLAPVALYTTWEEIWRTVRHLRQIVASGEHRQLDATPQVVA